MAKKIHDDDETSSSEEDDDAVKKKMMMMINHIKLPIIARKSPFTRTRRHT